MAGLTSVTGLGNGLDTGELPFLPLLDLPNWKANLFFTTQAKGLTGFFLRSGTTVQIIQHWLHFAQSALIF